MPKILRNITVCILLLFLGSCKPNGEKKSNAVSAGSKLIICCEGNFGWGNSDFDIYNLRDNELNLKVYKALNNASLGDVLQSASIWNGYLYLVVNNSGKIVALDTVNYIKQDVIFGFNSPRYMQAITNQKALVTDLYANKIYLIDRTEGIEQTFPVKGFCEGMAASDDEIAIACTKGTVYFFNKSRMHLSDSVELEKGSKKVIHIGNSFYTMCLKGSKSIMYEIQNKQATVTWDTSIHENQYVSFAFNKIKNEWLFMQSNKLYSMSRNFKNLKIEYSNPSANFYSISVNPTNGEVYISNAKDYVSAGEIIRLSSEYQFMHSAATGIIPGFTLLIE